MERRIIKLKDYTETTKATSVSLALMLNERICREFDLGGKVVVDFSNIDLVTMLFLEVAFGGLYKKYSKDYLRENIRVVNVKINHLDMLKQVNKEAFEQARKESQATELCKYLGRTVITPKGEGKLLQVFNAQITVHIPGIKNLKGDEIVSYFYDPSEVQGIEKEEKVNYG